MRKIQLDKGMFALVDDEDFEWINQWRWYFTPYGYAMRSSGKKVLMHRLIMNTPDGMDTDHIDRDKLNNQKGNLRICTRTQNKQNTNVNAGNKTGYKGVFFEKSRGNWRAYIVHNGKQINIGRYNDPVLAAKAYDAKALELFGEFANVNFK